MNSCVEDEYRNGVELHLSKVRFIDEICTLPYDLTTPLIPLSL
jgi:hypothetical protein